MATNITIPKLGLTMEEAIITEWLKQEGDYVIEGEPIVEIMTEKVNYEIESPASGVLRIVARKEEVIPIAGIIGYIVEAGEEIPCKPADSNDVTDVEQAPPNKASTQLRTDKIEKHISPAAKRVAEELGISGLELESIEGTGPQGRVTQNDVQIYQQSRGKSLKQVKTRITPLAQKIFNDKDIDSTEVTGTGVQGKILKKDVLQAIEDSKAGGGRVEALTGLRKIVAKRMTLSATTIPQFTLGLKANIERVISLRNDLQAEIEKAHGVKVTITDILVKLVAKALREFPRVNSSYFEEGITYSETVNVGVATATTEGLIVPVIRAAEQKTLGEICVAIKDLTFRARDGRLNLDDVSDGTFTISNLGMFGIEVFRAIINPPEAAILAVGKITDNVVLVEGQPRVDQSVWLNLTADHRVLDGAEAAQFLNRLKQLIENPILVLA